MPDETRVIRAHRNCHAAHQRGQALVVLALVGVTMFGFGALAIDQGVGMADRRDLQAAADNAALAGVRSSAQGTDAENWVAVEYMARSLGFAASTLAGQGCTSAVCPAKTYTAGNFTITIADNSGGSMDVNLQHSRRTTLAGVLGITTAVSGTGSRATPSGPVVVGIGYNVVVLGGDYLVHGGGVKSAASGNIGGSAYASGSLGANNGPHAIEIPQYATGVDSAGNPVVCSPQGANRVDLGGSSNSNTYYVQDPPYTSPMGPQVSQGNQNYNVTRPAAFTGVTPTTTGPTFNNGDVNAKDSKGNWKPGTYNGWYPTAGGGKKGGPGYLLGGVYVIKNVTSGLSLGSLQNADVAPNQTPAATPVAQGQADPNGVAFVLDSSDNGSSLSFSGSTLNGLDDLSGGTGPTPDPQGTHNFVVYGAGFTGGTDFGGAALSGIVYLPGSDAGSSGNSSWTLTGSVWMNTFTVNGGGNGTQVFQWVCGLSAVNAGGGSGGLVR